MSFSSLSLSNLWPEGKQYKQFVRMQLRVIQVLAMASRGEVVDLWGCIWTHVGSITSAVASSEGPTWTYRKLRIKSPSPNKRPTWINVPSVLK